MAFKLSREDHAALQNSVVYQELEAAEVIKQAQTLADKIVNSPSAQTAISEGIRKALENKDDDGEHTELKGALEKLDDHGLVEVFTIIKDAMNARGLDPAMYYEEEQKEKEEGHEEGDEAKEEHEMAEVLAYVKASLSTLADKAIDEGNTECAYLIERTLQQIDE